MAIDFEVTEHKPIAGPASTLVRVEFRPVPGEPVHSNIFHMQLYPTGRQPVMTSGQLITEGGVLIPILPDGSFPPANPTDPFKYEIVARDNDAEMVANIEAYWERKLKAAAEGHPYPQHHRSTVNLQVGAGLDDAHEDDDNTDFDATGDTVEARGNTLQGSRRNAGWRFTSVAITQADTIDAATMVIFATSTGFDDANVDIFGNDVDNAANFSDEADVTDRTLTAASVAWVADSLGFGTETSPEIKTVIQEIINRGSWASGNALVTMFRGKSDVDKFLTMRSYEGFASQAAKLDIDFTGGAPSTSLPSRYGHPMRHLMGR